MSTFIRTKTPVKGARFLFTWHNSDRTKSTLKRTEEDCQCRASRTDFTHLPKIHAETVWLIWLWKKDKKKKKIAFRLKSSVPTILPSIKYPPKLLAFNRRPIPFRKCSHLSATASDFSFNQKKKKKWQHRWNVGNQLFPCYNRVRVLMEKPMYNPLRIDTVLRFNLRDTIDFSTCCILMVHLKTEQSLKKRIWRGEKRNHLRHPSVPEK